MQVDFRSRLQMAAMEVVPHLALMHKALAGSTWLSLTSTSHRSARAMNAAQALAGALGVMLDKLGYLMLQTGMAHWMRLAAQWLMPWCAATGGGVGGAWAVPAAAWVHWMLHSLQAAGVAVHRYLLICSLAALPSLLSLSLAVVLECHLRRSFMKVYRSRLKGGGK